MSHPISRRSMLLAAASSSLWSGQAFSAVGGRMVVATWGGDYGDLLSKHVEQPLLKPKGIEVLQSNDNGGPRKAKLTAERSSRRGSLDVVHLSDYESSAMAAMNMFDAVNEQNVPNLKNTLPALRQSHAIPHIYSGLVIAYNPEKVKTPPQSLNDLWDPKYKGRVGFAEILYPYNVMAAALAAGGSMTDFKPGYAKLSALKPLEPKIYPTNEAVAQALKSEEIWMTLAWRSRAYQWRRAGTNLASVAPSEGIIPTYFTGVVPRNAQNKDNAFAYLNAMLEPSAQVAFAERMGYMPTVTNVTVPAELSAQIGFTERELSLVKPLDFAYMASMAPEMLQFWSREFKG